MNKVMLTILKNLENARLVGLCAKQIACESFDEIALAEIELAAVEAVNNCIEHTCTDKGDNQVIIEFCLTEQQLAIEMVDEGKAIEAKWLDNLHKALDFDPDDIENLPEGGMGLKIVRRCMDEVFYENSNNYNHWLLIKYRKDNNMQ